MSKEHTVKKYNDIVRKLNEFSPIFVEITIDEAVSMKDVRHLEKHYETCIKPHMASIR